MPKIHFDRTTLGLAIGMALLIAGITSSPKHMLAQSTAKGTTSKKGTPKTTADENKAAPTGFPGGLSVPPTVESLLRKSKPSDRIGGSRGAADSATAVPFLERGARRYAFVVANQTYTDLQPLHTPRIEAEAALDVLARNGFITQVHFDLTAAKFREALETFSRNLQAEDFVLFYYAGHAIEETGNNVLLPVDFGRNDFRIASTRGMRLDDVRAILGQKERPSLYVIDACRRDPLAGTTSAPPRISKLMMPLRDNEAALFSSSSQQDAFDGSGWSRSDFSRAFTYAFRMGELPILSAVNLVRSMLILTSDGEQLPELSIGKSFPSDTVARYVGGAGYLPTPLRTSVNFSPEIERALVRQLHYQRIGTEPVAGVFADSSRVLTSDRKWVIRQHTDATEWSVEKVQSSVDFLEAQLNLGRLTDAEQKLWAEVKETAGTARMLWLLEEISFRKADLPLFFGSIPEDSRESWAKVTSGEMSLPMESHSALGFLDWNLLSNALSGTDGFSSWPISTDLMSGKALDSKFDPDISDYAAVPGVHLDWCGIGLSPAERLCRKALREWRSKDHSVKEAGVLYAALRFSLKHQFPISSWITKFVQLPESQRVSFLTSAALSWLRGRVVLLASPELNRVISDSESQEENADNQYNCDKYPVLRRYVDLDPFSALGVTLTEACGFSGASQATTQRSNASFLTPSAYLELHRERAREKTTVDRNQYVFPIANRFHGYHYGDEIDDLHSSNAPYWQHWIVELEDALREQRPAPLWRHVASEITGATHPAARRLLNYGRVMVASWAALWSFDPTAAKFYSAAAESLDDEEPEIDIDDLDRTVDCAIDTLTGKPCYATSQVTDEKNSSGLQDQLRVTFSHSLNGHGKELDDMLAKLRTKIGLAQKDENLTDNTKRHLQNGFDGLERLVKKLRNPGDPSQPKKLGLYPLFGFDFSLGGLPAEIR